MVLSATMMAKLSPSRSRFTRNMQMMMELNLSRPAVRAISSGGGGSKARTNAGSGMVETT